MLAYLRSNTGPRTCYLMERGNVCFFVYAFVWEAEIWKSLTFPFFPAMIYFIQLFSLGLESPNPCVKTSRAIFLTGLFQIMDRSTVLSLSKKG